MEDQKILLEGGTNEMELLTFLLDQQTLWRKRIKSTVNH